MKTILLVIGAAVLGSGCASIVDGRNQMVSVEMRSNAAPVSGGSCRLVNDKGSWFVYAPGSAAIRRSYEDLSVQCRKPGFALAQATVKSVVRPLVFGNILIGGVVGAGVDSANGAAYDYPSPIVVELGDRLEGPASGQGKPPAETERERQEIAQASVLIGGLGCAMAQAPFRSGQRNADVFYEGRCLDGRVYHSVCRAGSCRLASAYD